MTFHTKCICVHGLDYYTIFLNTLIKYAYKCNSPSPCSLQALQTDYLDLFMLHSVGPSPAGMNAAWAEMKQMQTEGLLRSLGVSNFRTGDLTNLLAAEKSAGNGGWAAGNGGGAGRGEGAGKERAGKETAGTGEMAGDAKAGEVAGDGSSVVATLQNKFSPYHRGSLHASGEDYLQACKERCDIDIDI